MAEGKSIGEELKDTKKFREFLDSMSSEDQQKVLESDNFVEFVQAMSEVDRERKYTPEETIDLYEAGGSYFKSPRKLTSEKEMPSQSLPKKEESAYIPPSNVTSSLAVASREDAPIQESAPDAPSQTRVRVPNKRRRRRGAALASAGKGAAKQAGKQAVKKGAMWLFGTPTGWTILAIAGTVIVIIALFFIIIANICQLTNGWAFREVWAPAIHEYCTQTPSFSNPSVPPNPPGITTEKEGPFSVANGEEIEYTLRVIRDPSVAGVPPISGLSLFDVPLFEYQFVSATGGPAPGQDESGRTYYAWRLASQTPSSPNNYTFTFRIKPVKQDFNAINTIYVSDIFKEVRYEEPQTDTGGDPDSAGAGTTSTGPSVLACEGARTPEDIWYGADCAPNSQTCNGKWTSQMSSTRNNVNDLVSKGIIDRSKIVGAGYNFGDPKCTFNAARRGKIIREFEPNEKRAQFYEDIAKCEGTPNSFGVQDGPIGPAGHFQMNASGARGPAGGYGYLFKKWDPSDSEKGDLPWQRQIQNAIRNNNQDRSSGQDYFWWGVAYCLCYYPGYRNESVCDDIRTGGRIRQPSGQCSECTRTQGPKGLGG